MSQMHRGAVSSRPRLLNLAGRHPAVTASLVVIGALAALNIARYFLPSGTLWFSIGAAVALVAFARHRGLTWAQLGLSRHRHRAGVAWGVAAIGVVAAVYVVGFLLPVTREAFLDSRYRFGLSEALITAFVVIPLGTVLLEEVAFRSVLWGLLSRHMRTWRVLLVSSSLFGLWHVLPALHLASANNALDDVAPAPDAATTALVVLATVLFTSLGGVVAGELRRRSGSLLASAGMHWATNSLGVLFAMVAWRLAV